MIAVTTQKTCCTIPGGHALSRIYLPAVMALLITLTWEATARELRIRHRGNLIRTEIRKTTKTPFLRCHLAMTAGSFPQLYMEEMERLAHEEVPFYEVLLEIKDEDERDRENIEYILQPGEEIEGEMAVREEERAVGPVASAAFDLNGTAIRTDGKGIFTDQNQLLLQPFDDLSVRETTLTVSHERLGQVVLTLRRDLVLQHAVGMAMSESLAPVPDILVAMGLDFEQKRQSSHDGLHVSVVLPTAINPGITFPIQVQAENTGDKVASSVLCRLFSRQAWIHSRIFYIGALNPGEKRTFTRLVSVPADLSPQRVFAALGCWDILGPVLDRNQPIEFVVEPVKQEP